MDGNRPGAKVSPRFGDVHCYSWAGRAVRIFVGGRGCSVAGNTAQVGAVRAVLVGAVQTDIFTRH